MLLVIFAAVLVQAFIPMHGGSAICCPEYWTEYRGNCYRVFGQALTWQDADNYCQYSSGAPRGAAHLVSLHSQGESNFVKNLWNTITDNKVVEAVWRNMYWIGLNDIYHEGSFVYSDYSSYDFNNFHAGEPNNSGNQDCIVVWDYQKNGRATWDDQQCYNKHAFVCKMPKH
ncbi:echinoidin-like [Anneissia japonica]|uniref:echinoidin-like n=1 Tax=Anneissia japonica TaxID=1529436 RepID=UPI0014255E9D|nr:echinoidin-like [Anneissia japonica]